jgi:hypothetical protein
MYILSRTAGTPDTNTTFFCEALSGNCFLLRSATASQLSFYDAADTCAGFVGGNLVVYSSRSKQMLVEQYFGMLLPATYWLGASRASIGMEYTLTDGTAIQQVGGCPYNSSRRPCAPLAGAACCRLCMWLAYGGVRWQQALCSANAARRRPATTPCTRTGAPSSTTSRSSLATTA